MPADSFQVHITAPRAGTFMYHTHLDDVRQQTGGLYGPFIVIEPGTDLDKDHDLILMVASSAGGVVLNGSDAPAPATVRVGQTYRLRIANITVANPGIIVQFMRAGAPIQWRAVAKDGFDLPDRQATSRPARQPASNGEIFDFEVTPDGPGDMTFEVRSGAGVLLVALPVRVVP